MGRLTHPLLVRPRSNATFQGRIDGALPFRFVNTPLGPMFLTTGARVVNGREIPFWGPNANVADLLSVVDGYPRGSQAVRAEPDGGCFFCGGFADGTPLIRIGIGTGRPATGTFISDLEVIAPQDGIYWHQHGNSGGHQRAETPALNYVSDGLIVRAGMILAVGAHIASSGTARTGTWIDIRCSRNPDVRRGADGKWHLHSDPRNGWVQHWGNHGNWGGDIDAIFVRKATPEELARVPRPDYVERMLAA